MRTIILTITWLILIIAGPVLGQDAMKTHFLDVGQGSAALVEFSCGVILIDTGGESNHEFNSTDSLMKALDKFFTRRIDLQNTIDLLILSHPHKDHTLGVKKVLEKYKIKNAITNGQSTGSGKAGQIALHQLIAAGEGTSSTSDDIGYYESIVSKIKKGGETSAIIDPVNCTGTNPTIKVLWGQSLTNPGWTKTDFANQNNHSVVVRIDYGTASILFTGDLEAKAIPFLLAKHTDKKIFNVDVYVVGHHGSKNGSTLPFIVAITPKMAVMSFGDPNRQQQWTAYTYGHPNKGIVKMLTDNVSKTRPSKQVMVADGAENFENQTISKAVYGIGWDGEINLTATPAGEWSVDDQVGPALMNINTASKDDLTTLPSIGDTRADAIIAYRATRPFTSIDQLDDVPGIGPATVALVRPYVKVN